MRQTRRTILAAVAGTVIGLPRHNKPDPSGDELERVAKEMFLIAHTAACDSTSDPYSEWQTKWDDIRNGYRAGWMAIAKWHLEKLQ